MGRPTIKGAKLTSVEVALKLGIKHATWKQYVYEGSAPKADGRDGKFGSHWWYASTIAKWDAKRKEAKMGRTDNTEAYRLSHYNLWEGWWTLDLKGGYLVPGELAVFMADGYLRTKFKHWAIGSDVKEYSIAHHRVIYEHRLGLDQWQPIGPDMVVAHKNGIKYDNRLSNLYLISRADLLNGNRQWLTEDTE